MSLTSRPWAYENKRKFQIYDLCPIGQFELIGSMLWMKHEFRSWPHTERKCSEKDKRKVAKTREDQGGKILHAKSVWHCWVYLPSPSFEVLQHQGPELSAWTRSESLPLESRGESKGKGVAIIIITEQKIFTLVMGILGITTAIRHKWFVYRHTSHNKDQQQLNLESSKYVIVFRGITYKRDCREWSNHSSKWHGFWPAQQQEPYSGISSGGLCLFSPGHDVLYNISFLFTL